MKYSIIGNGLVGQTLKQQAGYATIYNRYQHNELLEKKHDIIVVAAPSSNRLTVNQYALIDKINCRSIVQTLQEADYNHVVYISTVDVYASRQSKNANPSEAVPTALYGQNRQWLENNISKLENSHIIRLPSLISPNLTKNILYDLKHQQWLSSVNLNSKLQWYSLIDIKKDIKQVVINQEQYTNLVSKPIYNRDIVSRYYPELVATLELNTIPEVQYDVRNRNGDYSVDTDIIWQGFTELFS
jgi:dTDP-4-dehydrorhamnose reductase